MVDNVDVCFIGRVSRIHGTRSCGCLARHGVVLRQEVWPLESRHHSVSTLLLSHHIVTILHSLVI